MNIKQYYVKITQREIELFPKGKHNERLIYESIKSYSANGNREVTLSLRNIAKRASISYSTVSRFLPKVIEMGVIMLTGSSDHIGGRVNTYKVLLPETDSVADRYETVARSKESVADSGTKLPQINNLIKKENISNYKVHENIYSSEEKMSNEVSRKIFAAFGGIL
ncbi:MAG: hypothetical protein WCT77_01015 [Bacteroidota bacterium]